MISVVVLIASLTAVAEPVGRGKVTYITGTEAYLDVGSANGLAPSTQLKLVRRKKVIGTCDVTEVSANRAVCKGQAENGDTFTFPITKAAPEGQPEQQQKADGKPRPKLPSQKELDARRKIVQEAKLPMVAHKKTVAGAQWSARASTTLRQQIWGSSATPNSTFARTSLDASMYAGIGLFPNMFSSASLTVWSDAVAPAAQRFRPGEFVELYVWNASVGVSDGLVVGELGRFRPKRVPGMLLLDGAQLGVRAIHALEIGAYGGVVPDLLTLYPRANTVAGGVYVASEIAAVDGLLIIPRARGGVLSTADFVQLRAEVEAQTEVIVSGIGSFGGSVRSSAGPPDFTPSLDAARVDAQLNISNAFRSRVGYRFLSAPVIDYDATSYILAAVPPIGGVHHANASASYEIASWLVVGATSGGGYDVAFDKYRGYIGPEIALPELFGSLGGMDLGYLEELGEWPGRSTWVGAHFAPLPVVRLSARASYFETEALGDDLREAAIFSFIDAPVLPWLAIRGKLSLHQGLPNVDGAARSTPSVYMADVGVTGSL